MRIFWPVLLALSLQLIAVHAPQQVFAVGKQMDLEAFLEKVEQEAAAVDSFSCSFIQTRHLAIFPSPVEFSGRLVLVRPDRLRWEFMEPIPSVLIISGKNGMKCSGKSPVRKFSLDSDPVMRVVADQLWAWTSGSYRQLGDTFTFELLAGLTLSLKPLQNVTGSFVEQIRIVFDPETFQPVEIEIREPGNEDRTVIHFSDYRRNIMPGDHLFTECMSKR